MMRRLIITLTIIIAALSAQAQWTYPIGTPTWYKKVRVDSVFWLNTVDTVHSYAILYPGALMARTTGGDTSLYMANGTKWVRIGSASAGGGTIDSAYRSNDTLFFRYASGGELPVRYPTKIVSNVDMLATIPGDTGVMVVVKENGRGGTFVWSATGTANGGTKFSGLNGIWNRMDTTVTGIYNVKWWGAKGDYDLTVGTNDAPAIQRCIDYLASIKSLSFRPTLYLPESEYYLISSGLVVPYGINILTLGDIAYNGPSTGIALTVGTAGQSNNKISLRISIRQRIIPSWTDTAITNNNIGIRIINAVNSEIVLPTVAFFCNNIVLEGDNTGGSASAFAYNSITIGSSIDAIRHLTLFGNGTAGWVNENKFNAGNFQNSSSTSTRQESRYGITLRTISNAIPNNNIFYKPCFQLGYSTLPDKVTDSTIAIMVEKGNANNFYDIRSENSGPVLMVCKDVSFGNYAHTNIFGLDNKNQLVDLSSSRNNYVVSDLAKYSGVASGASLIFSSGFLPDKTNKYDVTRSYIQGVSWTRQTDGNLYSSGAGVTLHQNHLSLMGSERMGVFVNTDVSKKFAIKWDVVNQKGGRLFVRIYDGSGNVITPTSTLISPAALSGNIVSTYGGGYVLGADATGRYFNFAVDTSVKKMYVAIGSGTDTLQIKSWQLYSLDNLTAAVYSGIKDYGGFGLSTIQPTEVKPKGTIILNDLSVSSTPLGWRNTDGGTTWESISDYYTKGESDARYPLLDSLYNPLDTLNNWVLSGPAPSLISNSHTGEGFVANIGGDTLINIFRSDETQNHVSNSGKIVQRYSYDGGLTWTTPSTIFDSGNDDRNVIGTITSSGRIVTIFRQFNAATSTQVSVGYITSTDGGQTWSAYTTISTAVANLIPFGAIVRRGDGSYFSIFYTSNYAEAITSADGIAWASAGSIYDYRASNPTRMTSEAYPAYVGDNRMVVLVRNDNLIGGPFYQLNSTDNGTSFSWQGNTNIGGDTLSRTAPFIMWDSLKNMVIAAGCQRHVYSNSFTNNFRDTKNDSLVIYLNRPDDIFSTPTAYTQKASFPRPEPDIRYFYGYPTATKLSNGVWFFIFSDENAKGGTDPDGNSNKTANLWQFDLSYISSYYDLDSCRYGGLVKQYNSLTGKYDNGRPYSQWAHRADSVLVNRANATVKIISPMWADTASALQVVGRNDNSVKWNVRGDGFTDIYSRVKVRGGSPGTNKVLTDIDGTGQAEWRDNTLNSTTINGNWTDQPVIVYGNVFARWYKFINQGNTSEPPFSPFFRYDETTQRFIWGNANRTSMGLDTIGNLRLTAALKPNGLPGTTGQFLVSQGDNTPPIWQTVNLNFISNQIASEQSASFWVQVARASRLESYSATGSNFFLAKFSTGGFNQWGIRLLNAVTGVGNSGNDLAFYGYNDAGAELGNWLTIKRSNGNIGLNNGNPNSTLHLTGSLAATITSVSGNTTLNDSHFTVEVSNTGSATITLPSVSTAGRLYVIKKLSAGGNDVIVDGAGADQIDGAATKTLTLQYSSIIIQSDGIEWRIIGAYATGITL